MNSSTSNSDQELHKRKGSVQNDREEAAKFAQSDDHVLPDDRDKRYAAKPKPVRRRSKSWMGLAAFVLLLVLAELFIFRNVMLYGLSPGFVGQYAELEASFAAQQHMAVEQEASKGNSFNLLEGSHIKVAIWGDSQSMDALRPELLAAYSEYEPEEIFNFSISGGSAFDIAQMVEQYIDSLPELEQSIVVVNEHQFNEARNAEDIKFKFKANLQERLMIMNKHNYGDLLLGWLLKSYDMRSVWTMLIDKWRQDELRDEVPSHPGGLPAVTWSPSDARTQKYAIDTADRWFEDYKLEGPRAAAFEDMLAELQSRDIDTVILQLPRSELFEQAVQTHYPQQKQQHEQLLEAWGRDYGMNYEHIPNDQLKLEDDFRDTNHVNPQGAEWVSRYVAERYLR